eukprot:12906766-Prorocentrum_lima.AAC.1
MTEDTEDKLTRWADEAVDEPGNGARDGEARTAAQLMRQESAQAENKKLPAYHRSSLRGNRFAPLDNDPATGE